MKKYFLFAILSMANFFVIPSTRADYIDGVDFYTMTYDLNDFTIPTAVGEVSNIWHDNGSILYKTISSGGKGSYFELSVNGTLLGDGVSWATSNPGIGIQFKLEPGDPFFDPSSSTVAPNYRLDLDKSNGSTSYTTYLHLRYRLIRLLDNIPAGKITSAPSVTLNVYNPDGSGPAFSSGLILSGITSQPTITPCTINAPSSITLPPIYGNSLVEGAQGITDAPQITLTNCPGAINNIIYDFAATYYSTHSYANGIFTTKQGDGYAKNVYIQLQDATGTGIHINSPLTLPGYTGSGDYAIPDFRIAYFIDSGTLDTVTAGQVETAVDFTVTYN